jgi:hypothetical protein
MRKPVLLVVLIFVVSATPVVKSQVDPFRSLFFDIMNIEGTNLRPLLASAEASEAAFMRGDFCASAGALGALENKLEARVGDDENARLVLGDITAIRNLYPPGPCKGLSAPPEPE